MPDLLVRATSLDDWDPGVHCAAQLAASLRGSLTALYVVPGTPPAMLASAWDGGGVATAYAAELAREVQDAQKRSSAFTAWASSLGVHHPAWLACAGEVADAVAYVGNWHDLLVLPLDDDSEDPWSGPGGVAKVVLRASMPSLVVPRSATVPARFDTIAVAWNGSTESIRALHCALPLLRAARRVLLILGQRKLLLGPLPPFSLEDWCARHLAHAESVSLGAGIEGEAILNAAGSEGAQLLVMGAYGHSRLSEWMLGGVTRYMLQNAGIPLLMRH